MNLNNHFKAVYQGRFGVFKTFLIYLLTAIPVLNILSAIVVAATIRASEATGISTTGGISVLNSLLIPATIFQLVSLHRASEHAEKGYIRILVGLFTLWYGLNGIAALLRFLIFNALGGDEIILPTLMLAASGIGGFIVLEKLLNQPEPKKS